DLGAVYPRLVDLHYTRRFAILQPPAVQAGQERVARIVERDYANPAPNPPCADDATDGDRLDRRRGRSFAALRMHRGVFELGGPASASLRANRRAAFRRRRAGPGCSLWQAWRP